MALRLKALVLVLGTLSLCAAAGAGIVGFSAVRAGADPIGSCSTATGVIVAVDFSHFGGNVERGCSSTPTTGYQALQSAGFATAGDAHDGPAFICRITDPATGVAEPPPSADPCITTPPATAYWSYWHAGAGQNTWTYSRQGAMSYAPPPGSVDAWTFGAGNPPPFSPSAVEATNAPPAGGGPASTVTTASPPTLPGEAPPTTAVVAPGAAPAASPGSHGTGSAAPAVTPVASSARSTSPSGNPTPSITGETTAVAGSGSGVTGSSTSIGDASATPSRDGANPKTSSSATPRGNRATPKIVNVGAAAAHPRSSTGSPLPFAIGGFVVVALAASGGFVAWRRRSASS